MKLNSLELKNFRCFESINIDFDEQLTVLVAENGAGKTTILDGIAVALGVFVGSFDTGVNKGFKSQDALLSKIEADDNRGLTNMEAQYPIVMTAQGIIQDKPETWRRKLTGAKSKTTVAEASSLRSYGKHLQEQVRTPNTKVDLPIVAYYGTGRLWRQIQARESFSKESLSRLFAYHDALEPASSYKEFEKWFRDTARAEYDAIVAKVQSHQTINPSDLLPKEANTLKSVREAVNICLKITGWNGLQYDAKSKELVIKDAANRFFAVNQLSDGVKNMLAMTADIAYRCAKLNPHLTNAHQETEGVVLIDEIDMHLHPKWQQTVLQDLQKSFPKIQFIVTTHSPQVLTTVKAEHIRILSNDNQSVTIPSINTYGEESKVTLEDVLHVSSRPVCSDGKSQRLKEYLQRINQGDIDSSDIIMLRKQLESDFGESYSKLKLADMVINKWQAKRSMS
ncbi:MAG: AAA family ATPase [Methylococcaceae bacterium]|nr:AAA family ATPase [Methylococcaceae bacterium]